MAPQTLKQIREKQRANRKSYHERMKNDPEYKRKQKENYERWYLRKKLKQQKDSY